MERCQICGLPIVLPAVCQHRIHGGYVISRDGPIVYFDYLKEAPKWPSPEATLKQS